ncbi:thiamine ABC transporter substrate-binding protein [Nocardioides sp. S5]|uniref:thiamine ABC transporter substrate-binding protein n=1 Tax=Nocardioides sp. S5 TaxID=2017486 RepID=UPI001A8CB213|nr:thiamine ABC transporter substrate-binding protein [Nocardioides sp. S5]QSR29445.1 thiamine ABC transporter substrate-binding protein [Nocardioides sp. S5]
MHRTTVRAALATGLTPFLAALLLTSCSLTGGEATDPSTSAPDGGSSPAGAAGGTVVLATHESFNLPKKLVRSFEDETGYTLEVRAAGDAGTLATKLSLTADNPIADAAFGIDNTFASRPLGEGAFAEVTTSVTPPEEYALPEGSDRLVAIDSASVCVNVDTAWFAEEGLEPPQTLADLTDPAYADLLVTPGASTSSPGMAFFLATVAEHGDDWASYWTDLLANGAKVVDGWEDAYYGDFTAGSKNGTRPIVVSYDSSPAFTVADGETTTAALLDTCFRQVEYAGVLAGADNPEGAAALIDWMLTDEVQSALPESMYVFPVMPGATVPDDWAQFAPQPTDPYEVSPEEIAANREQWLTEWTDVISR